MKNPIVSLYVVSAIVASLAFSQSAAAQSKAASVPPPPPIKLEKIEEVEDQSIKTIKPEPKKTVTKEKRMNGEVTEVEVKSGPSTYTVKKTPNTSQGTVDNRGNQVAQWTLLEIGGKKEKKEVEPLPTLPVNPDSLPKTTAPATESKTKSVTTAVTSPNKVEAKSASAASKNKD
jgi:hypothetical protein